MTDREPVERRSPFSALGSPVWLNPTSVKGTIAIGVGLFVLGAAPSGRDGPVTVVEH